MRGTVLFFALTLIAATGFAQQVYTIKADSTKLIGCDSNELIIENHTQNVPGFLFNTGHGRTVFKRGLQPIGGSSYLIGADTLNLATSAWVQGGNNFGATGILGTTDSNHLDFYTNHTFRGRFTATGGLLLGTTSNPFNDALVANGTARFGNGILLNYGDIYNSRLFASGNLQIQSNAVTGYQIYFSNQMGAAFTGPSVVRMGCNYSTLGATQGILQISGNQDSSIAFFKANGNTILGNTSADNGQTLQVAGSTYFNGTQQVTGTTNNTHHTIFNPTIDAPAINGTSSAYSFSPTLISHIASQNLFGVSITPTYNLNGFAQSTDNISPALYINSGLGGIRIDQVSSYNGNTGQPLYILQSGSSDKAAIKLTRGNNLTHQPLIWIVDTRPDASKGDLIPVINNSITNPVAGGGISITMDRYYFGTEASIDMHYETTPDTTANENTSIAFNTVSSGARITPLYINGANTGFGTKTPSAQLHITGTVRFAGLTADSTQTRILVSDASGNLFYRSASSLATEDILRSSLAVNGPIKARSLTLSASDWPDYVFDSSYQLPALDEVENYIQRQHHLPGIPSAAEASDKGFDVGANQAVLLKKIEELTLYAIGQQRGLQDQKDKNLRIQQKLSLQDERILSLNRQMEELKNIILNITSVK